jgi:hypothetical protein
MLLPSVQRTVLVPVLLAFSTDFSFGPTVTISTVNAVSSSYQNSIHITNQLWLLNSILHASLPATFSAKKACFSAAIIIPLRSVSPSPFTHRIK